MTGRGAGHPLAECGERARGLWLQLGRIKQGLTGTCTERMDLGGSRCGLGDSCVCWGPEKLLCPHPGS